VKLHKAAHGVDGMIGSLDCTHTFWKNCPKAWQGSYKGKELKPLIVMESIADYFLFLWHASYGYTGTLNDNSTILHLSPFMDRLLDGTFHEVEAEAAVVPFMIKEEQFNKVFALSMVSTPRTADLSGESKCPLPGKEKKYTSWQEGTRKDVERAFGVLKNTWQCLDRPILLHDLNDDISNRVVSCLLLHNILVTDRVMQEASDTYYNYRERYDPSVGAGRPSNCAKCSCPRKKNSQWNQQCPPTVQAAMTRIDRCAELNDLAENRRLHMALMANFNT
jgi:hypothetical protein